MPDVIEIHVTDPGCVISVIVYMCVYIYIYIYIYINYVMVSNVAHTLKKYFSGSG